MLKWREIKFQGWQLQYGAVNFHKDPHKIHPMFHPNGWAMGFLLWLQTLIVICSDRCNKIPDSKVNGAKTRPTWILLAPDGPHVGPMNLAIRYVILALIGSASRRYLNHGWLIVNWTLRNTVNQIWIKMNNFSLKKSHLSQPQCVKDRITHHCSINWCCHLMT